jgi:hypothetical protein
MTTSLISGISKNALIALNEGIEIFGKSLSKLGSVLLGKIFCKISDSRSFLVTETEKCFYSLCVFTSQSNVLSVLLENCEDKRYQARNLIAKGILKILQLKQKDIFLFKEYEKLVKAIAMMSRDANAEVRQVIKECIQILSELSDDPSLILKSLNRHSQGSEAQFEETAGKERKIKEGLKNNLKLELLNLKIRNSYNMADEIIKENQQSYSKAGSKVSLPYLNQGEEGGEEGSRPLPNQFLRKDMLKKSKKQPIVYKHFHELDLLQDYITQIDMKGNCHCNARYVSN